MTQTTVYSHPLTLFILVRALPAWLALSRAERQDIAASALPRDDTQVRLFDCEAFSAMCSDIWMLSAPGVGALNTAMERLRDTPLFAQPYFDFVAILPVIENGWRDFEAAEAGQA
ncbi:darcynin family protein [Phaeobacter sp. HF9A]|uniref:darcynin family protein n=1 Tax=Phaeobacter sp. HF9A TaxID=2721561 RepID=UPI00143190DA|nr:darcynin family protein [Phaeobacter sp. HF9A]NIZ12106.1 hypothetical protein [Phaeobacter sp. HF9A]